MSWNRKKYNRKKHEECVQAIFDDLSSLDVSELFVRVDQIISDSNSENCQPEYIAELSVLTPKIYEYDQKTILRYEPKRKDTNTAISIKNYRPFFVLVTIRISEKDLFKFRKLKNKWLKAEFHRKPEDDDYPANLILLSGTRPRPIIDKRNIKISNGTCSFNGNDINDLTKTDYNVNQFNNCLVTTKNIIAELSYAWSNKGYKFIDIYNVGHGNADYIVCHDNKRILYDIGAPYKVYSLKSYPKAKQAFSQLKPNLVIISHWDADHYMGCGYASDDVFDVTWIAPQLVKGRDNSINLFRLVAFLMITGKLMLINRNNAGNLVASSGINDNVIKLRMGSCTVTETQNITKKNREGLYIELGEKADKISVLAGDVSYNSMDISIFSKQLTFLHVPHHGSQMKLSRQLNSQWGKHAIISTKYKLGSTEVNFSHERVLNTTFNKSVHNTSEQHGSLRSIRLLKGGLVQKKQ